MLCFIKSFDWSRKHSNMYVFATIIWIISILETISNSWIVEEFVRGIGTWITLPKKQSTLHKGDSPAKNEHSHNWPDNREREQLGQSDCWRGAVQDGRWTLIRGVHLYYTSRQLWGSSIMAGWRPGPRPYGKITDRGCSWMLQHHQDTWMSFPGSRINLV